MLEYHRQVYVRHGRATLDKWHRCLGRMYSTASQSEAGLIRRHTM